MRKTLEIGIILLLLMLFCVNKGNFMGWRPGVPPGQSQTEADDGSFVSLEEARALFPDAATVKSAGKGIYEVRKGRNRLGFAMKSEPYSKEIVGFMGPTPLLIGLDGDMRIRKVIALDNEETPRFFQRVREKGLLDSWNGLTPKEVGDNPVITVTGATYSSNGVIGSMQARMAALDGLQPPPPRDWRTPAGNVCFLMLLALGLFGFFAPGLLSKWRLALLAADIVVLALWQGRLLSMAQFMMWVASGIPLEAQWGIVLLFLLSILLPLFTGRAYYCAWICPMGAAQELLGKLNRRHKLKPGAKLLQWLQVLRTAVLFGVMLAMGLGLGLDFSDFEAFTVFHPGSAPIAALTIGLVSLVLSVWVQRPWCRFLCPLGEMLEIVRRK